MGCGATKHAKVKAPKKSLVDSSISFAYHGRGKGHAPTDQSGVTLPPKWRLDNNDGRVKPSRRQSASTDYHGLPTSELKKSKGQGLQRGSAGNFLSRKQAKEAIQMSMNVNLKPLTNCMSKEPMRGSCSAPAV